MSGQQTSPTRTWIAYSALRLLFFGVPLLVIYAFSANVVLSAVVAAVIGLCLSLVLLDGQRGAVARLIARRAEKRRTTSDEAAEDRLIEDEGAGDQSASAAARPKP